MRERDYADFLPGAEAVAARRPSPAARWLALTVAGLVAAAAVWAETAEVEQTATAAGQVRPAGRVKVIAHEEGGRIAELRVRNGQPVATGEVLIRLDETLRDQEIRRLAGERRALQGRVARLAAEAEGRRPVYPKDLVVARPDIVEAQDRLYRSRQQALAVARSAAERTVERRESEVARLLEEGEEIRRSLAIVEEQAAALGSLAERGYFPRLRYLSVRRQVNELKGRLAATEEDQISAFAALSEARDRRLAIDRERRAETLAELEAARRELERVTGALAAERARRARLEIRAPAAGIVEDLTVTHAGQAVAANTPLMKIVPTGEDLLVEAWVRDRDIGHIRVGQPARVKVRTYDFVRYGSLQGRIEQIAADATTNPLNGERAFAVLVRTKSTHLGDDAEKMPVKPGMAVEVDLPLGRESILSYLTDRVRRTAAEAFTER